MSDSVPRQHTTTSTSRYGGVTGTTAFLSALAPNLPSTNVRTGFRRAVYVRDAVSPNRAPSEPKDAVSPIATNQENEHSHEPLKRVVRPHESALSPALNRTSLSRSRERVTTAAPLSKYDNRDLEAAFHHCGVNAQVCASMPTPSNTGFARVFCSVWRRILRTHPDYIVHDVDPGIYGRQYSATSFRDPPFTFESFIAHSFRFSSSSEPLAPLMVLYWIDQLAQMATADAVRFARSPTDFHDRRTQRKGQPYKHHWLVGSTGYGVPVSAGTLDMRFPLRHYLALLLMAFNVHGDYNFSVRHLIAEWLQPTSTTAGCIRTDMVPFEAASIGALQWNIAARLNFSMMVFGDDLVAMLGRYLSFDELAFIGRIAEI